MSSSAARRVGQLNAHLTDAPVDQIQRFPTAAVKTKIDKRFQKMFSDPNFGTGGPAAGRDMLPSGRWRAPLDKRNAQRHA